MTLRRTGGRLFHPLPIAALCVVMLAGCTASRVPFPHTAAYVPADDIPPPWNHAAVAVVDERPDRGLDEALTTAADQAVGEALAAELRSSGVAVEASYGTHPADAPIAELMNQGMDAQLIATIQDLRWEIVNYDTLLVTAFVVGLFTGLIGMIIMSATDTDVDGHAKVDVKLTDLESEKWFAKTYTGHCEKEWPTFESDQPTAKARMAACAFELAIRDMRADLEAFAATLQAGASPPPPVVSSGRDN